MKLTLIYLLATQPQFGIYGVAAAISVNMTLVTILHWNSVVRLVSYRFPFVDVLKTSAAAAAAGAAAHILFTVEWHPYPLLRFAAASAASLTVYVTAVIMLKLVDRDDWERIPFSKKA